MAFTVSFVCIALIALGVYHAIQRRKYTARLPPQPTALPFIGNIHQFAAAASKKSLHLQLEQWARKYGDIFRVQLGPISIYYLNTDVAVKVRESFRAPRYLRNVYQFTNPLF